jgi:hypothetical protein
LLSAIVGKQCRQNIANIADMDGDMMGYAKIKALIGRKYRIWNWTGQT